MGQEQLELDKVLNVVRRTSYRLGPPTAIEIVEGLISGIASVYLYETPTGQEARFLQCLLRMTGSFLVMATEKDRQKKLMVQIQVKEIK